MKVGIIVDSYKMNIHDLLQTWALQKRLTDTAIQTLVINETKKPDFCNAEDSNKTVNRNSEEYRIISDFAREYFAIFAGQEEVTAERGYWNEVDANLITDQALFEQIQKEKTAYRELSFFSKAILLQNAVSYQEISEAPSLKKKYMLVHLTDQEDSWLSFAEELAEREKMNVVTALESKEIGKCVATFKQQDVAEFLGYINQAKFIISDSLPVIMLAVIFGKPFLAAFTKKADKELQIFLSQMDMDNHLLQSPSEFKNLLYYDPNSRENYLENLEYCREDAENQMLSSLPLKNIRPLVDCPTMIPKKKCYGCGACAEVCPKKAITMEPDWEGTMYPVADNEKCDTCGLCSEVCIRKKHRQHIALEKGYPYVYSAMHKEDAIRAKAVSGGIYPALARYIIKEKKGIVIGANFDNEMVVRHQVAETVPEALAFCGLKPVKSNAECSFSAVKTYLEEGRYVLFTGVGCECAALRAFLKKEYQTLLVYEILCNGMPSPKIFGRYLLYLNRKLQGNVKNITFFEKKKGWQLDKNRIIIEFKEKEPFRIKMAGNNYYQAYKNHLLVRQACGSCIYQYDKRAGDLTVGAFHGVQKLDKEMFDNKGTSLLMINNLKAKQIWDEISKEFQWKDSNLEDAFRYFEKTAIKISPFRDEFFRKQNSSYINQLLGNYNDDRNDL